MEVLRKLFKGGLGMELKTLATALKTRRTMIFAYDSPPPPHPSPLLLLLHTLENGEIEGHGHWV
ncbi:hypothetical protein AMTR_s00079p00066130 [Amborella trichopoda]|uniref:Uncharacterized protein n=1 Tax=Amborella trichopoda TaxID=13333 RepID=W1PAC2_AMBTC|nr:hypothetical protein AMTR_s00079p00066130 [Amborella trichopoda]